MKTLNKQLSLGCFYSRKKHKKHKNVKQVNKKDSIFMRIKRLRQRKSLV